ncbi:MADS-box protein ZMM17-like [Phalaenopsis equestris]|uniref:MADS-box protein ZMM17-like n=1 Tax=Phalaenopsis equestris TaxID=78828 RepID=UPI0009E36FB2|nr:MADS-box protein ZMM17-like [Phalaenopsis equestris]
MGRGKIEIKRIDSITNRQVTFSKRRGGLLKKAHELAVLTDARVGVMIFSASGRLYQYNSPGESMERIIEDYLKVHHIQLEDLNSHQLLQFELAKIKQDTHVLQASIRQFTGEDLTGLTINDLNLLEEQLDYSVSKIRTRKHELLHQQLENLRRKEHILADQNTCLYRSVMEMEQERQMEEEHKLREMSLLEPFGHFLEDSRSMLQLGPQTLPFQLQPTQPNLQYSELHGHGLQLW